MFLCITVHNLQQTARVVVAQLPWFQVMNTQYWMWLIHFCTNQKQLRFAPY